MRRSRQAMFVFVVSTACGSAAPAALRSPEPAAGCGNIDDCVRACESGDGTSCYAAGTQYELGEGVSQDYARAAALYEKGCQSGSPGACNNLGTLYEIGLAVEQDDARALEFYQRGCSGGDQRACDNEQRRKQ